MGVLFEDAAGHFTRVMPALTEGRAKGAWDLLMWAQQHGAPVPAGVVAMYRVERRRVVACALFGPDDEPRQDSDPDAGVREPRRPRTPQGGAAAQLSDDH